jgi:hypothetical protein
MINFQIVNIEVSKIYNRDIDPFDSNAIEEREKFVQAFVNSCGYTWDEYLWQWSGLNKLN